MFCEQFWSCDNYYFKDLRQKLRELAYIFSQLTSLDIMRINILSAMNLEHFPNLFINYSNLSSVHMI